VHWELEDCDGILKLIELYEDDSLLYLVLEYQTMGSLLTEMMRKNFMNESQIKVVIEQLLLTLDYIHEKGIVHRDIKLDNILINKIEEAEYDVKIADFGLAAFLAHDGSKLDTKCGTPGYVAPEILRGSGYSHKCDIFSLGVVFFNLITGSYLFSGNNNQEILYYNKMCQIEEMIQAL
jgi:serine/threonine protein kinase